MIPITRRVSIARAKSKSPLKQEGGTSVEDNFNKSLGNPKGKAEDNVWTRYEEDNTIDMQDTARHATSSQYTTEALRNKMPLGLGNSMVGRIASATGANLLGAAHEAKGLYTQIKGGRRVVSAVAESAEDLINNFAGSMVGAIGNSNMDKSKNKIIDKMVKHLPDGRAKESMYKRKPL